MKLADLERHLRKHGCVLNPTFSAIEGKNIKSGVVPESVSRQNGNSKIAANRLRKKSLDFVVPWNGFLSSRQRIAPNRVAPAFAHRHAAMLLHDGQASPGALCQLNNRRFRFGIEPKRLIPLGLQQEHNSFLQIQQTFLFGFPLSVRPGDFQARRPISAFPRFALMDNSRKCLHVWNSSRILNRKRIVLLRPSARGAGVKIRALASPNLSRDMAKSTRCSPWCMNVFTFGLGYESSEPCRPPVSVAAFCHRTKVYSRVVVLLCGRLQLH